MKLSQDKKHEVVEIQIKSGYSSHGRSTCYIDCPFCNEQDIECFIWSLNGSGKLCPNCKKNKSHVLLTFGLAFRRLTKEELKKQ